jgi:hypothetical protein
LDLSTQIFELLLEKFVLETTFIELLGGFLGKFSPYISVRERLGELRGKLGGFRL